MLRLQPLYSNKSPKQISRKLPWNYSHCPIHYVRGIERKTCSSLRLSESNLLRNNSKVNIFSPFIKETYPLLKCPTQTVPAYPLLSCGDIRHYHHYSSPFKCTEYCTNCFCMKKEIVNHNSIDFQIIKFTIVPIISKSVLKIADSNYSREKENLKDVSSQASKSSFPENDEKSIPLAQSVSGSDPQLNDNVENTINDYSGILKKNSVLYQAYTEKLIDSKNYNNSSSSKIKLKDNYNKEDIVSLPNGVNPVEQNLECSIDQTKNNEVHLNEITPSSWPNSLFISNLNATNGPGIGFTTEWSNYSQDYHKSFPSIIKPEECGLEIRNHNPLNFDEWPYGLFNKQPYYPKENISENTMNNIPEHKSNKKEIDHLHLKNKNTKSGSTETNLLVFDSVMDFIKNECSSPIDLKVTKYCDKSMKNPRSGGKKSVLKQKTTLPSEANFSNKKNIDTSATSDQDKIVYKEKIFYVVPGKLKNEEMKLHEKPEKDNIDKNIQQISNNIKTSISETGFYIGKLWQTPKEIVNKKTPMENISFNDYMIEQFLKKNDSHSEVSDENIVEKKQKEFLSFQEMKSRNKKKNGEVSPKEIKKNVEETSKIANLKGKRHIIRLPLSPDDLPSVGHNKSMLDVITSIDKSSVIIQKDCYITNKIIKNIKKEKEKISTKLETKNETVKPEKIVNYTLNKESTAIPFKKHFPETNGLIFQKPNNQNCSRFSESTIKLKKSFSPKTVERSKVFFKNNEVYLSPSDKPRIPVRNFDTIKTLGYSIEKTMGDYNGKVKVFLTKNKDMNKTSIIIDKITIDLKPTNSFYNNNISSNIINSQNLSSKDFIDSLKSVLKNIDSKPQKVKSNQCRFSHSSNAPTDKIDVKTKTVITKINSGDKTNVEVFESQIFTDKRLPLPFITESVFQVFGKNESLKEEVNNINLTKAKLESSIRGFPVQVTDIHKNPSEKKTPNRTIEPVSKIPNSRNNHSKFKLKGKNIHNLRLIKRNDISKFQDMKKTIKNRKPKFPTRKLSSDREPLRDTSKDQATKRKTFHDFEEVKVINAKDFEKIIQDIAPNVKSGDTNSTVIPIKVEDKAEKKLPDKKKAQGSLDKTANPPIKRKRRPRLKQTVKSTEKTNTPVDTTEKPIIEIKPVIKNDPTKEKVPNESKYVDLTKFKPKKKKVKIDIIDAQTKLSSRKGSLELSQRDEKIIKNIIEKPTETKESKPKEQQIKFSHNIQPRKKDDMNETKQRIAKTELELRKQSPQSNTPKLKDPGIYKKSEQSTATFPRVKPPAVGISPECSKIKPVRDTSKPKLEENPNFIKKEIQTIRKEIKLRRKTLKSLKYSDFEIDVDKLSKEIKPIFNSEKCVKCNVPVEKVMQFPLLNKDKSLGYLRPKQGILSISHSKNPELSKVLATYPSVTRILNSTMDEGSRTALRNWRISMISQLGEKGFQEFYKGQLLSGTEFHNCVKSVLEGNKIAPTLAKSTNQCVKSADWVLKLISDVSTLESQVVHSDLGYRGVVDCIAKYRNKPVLIEWKRSDKPKPLIQHTFDAPVQLSAYVGGLNFDNNYKFQVKGGLIVVAYTDGTPADIFQLSLDQCNDYWKKWLTRYQQYLLMQSPKKLS